MTQKSEIRNTAFRQEPNLKIYPTIGFALFAEWAKKILTKLTNIYQHQGGSTALSFKAEVPT